MDRLPAGYYYVTVTYDGAKGFDSSSSPVFEVSPGSVESWVAEISPANLLDCEEDPSAPLACRIGGQNRFNVSAKISELGFDPGVDVVYIANGLNYPDALSAAPAASLEAGPLLLVEPTAIPAPILAELTRLHPAKIVVVGGPGSVSPAVFNQLRAIQPNIVRLGGSDRYEASRAVANYAWGGVGSDVAYITTGRNFPDALSAGGAAANQSAPVITVDGQATMIDDETKQLLLDLGVTVVKIAGGPGSVSQSIVDSIDALPNVDVIRLWGQDRYEASGAINRDAFSEADVVFLSVGTNYPDALSGGALAGAFAAPIYVIPKTCIPSYVLDDIQSFGATTVIVLGGPGSVAQSVLGYAEC
jgi:putative cell wall-binding protein